MTSDDDSTAPYDPVQDPDADPDSLLSDAPAQPDQAEGEDDPDETGSRREETS
ncbi:hypothetical protein OED52_17865 [Rhodococcus sp. Z13]|uniref:Uncharacterized protein n=1 Tax=Rhodococcus sacchari TaxID=2962047 RepID=A0ACD4DES9_9NOCA|nr:hypothetical protein [Rhodococcus sp. Z13]UYP18498.1 hypothetical protein OED52_17865 [Rhodococcus sp. Z13]